MSDSEGIDDDDLEIDEQAKVPIFQGWLVKQGGSRKVRSPLFIKYLIDTVRSAELEEALVRPARHLTQVLQGP